MSRVEESELPGVGTRFSFETDERRNLGVIQRHDGRREVFVCDQDDPDCVSVSLSLEPDEAHVLADLLGGTEVTRDVASATQAVAGLSLDWVDVTSDGSSIGDHQVRSRTGSSVVAVLRDGEPHPAPGPEFVLHAGDVVLVVGTLEGVKQARALLQEDAS